MLCDEGVMKVVFFDVVMLIFLGEVVDRVGDGDVDATEGVGCLWCGEV